MNLIGLGFGPTWLGAVSDWLRPTHPENSLQLAFYSLVPFYLDRDLSSFRAGTQTRTRTMSTDASNDRRDAGLTRSRWIAFIDHAAKWHGAAEVVTGGGGDISARITIFGASGSLPAAVGRAPLARSRAG